MKKILIILGSIVAILVGFLLAVVFFFPKEKIRELAVQQGSKALGRPIQVGDVSVTLWGGFGAALHDLVVENPAGFGGEPLARVELIDVKVALFPLLSGVVQIDKLIVEKPQITLLKNASGSVNYTFATDTSAVTADSSASNGQIAVGRVVIQGGVLNYHDDSTKLSAHLGGLALQTEGALSGAVTTVKGQLTVDTIFIANPDTLSFQNLTATSTLSFDQTTKGLNIQEYLVTLGALELSGSGNLVTGGTVTNGSIKGDLKKVALSQLLSMMTPVQRKQLESYSLLGDVAATAEITLAGTDSLELSYTASGDISPLSVKSTQVNGELRADSLSFLLSSNQSRVWLSNGSFANQPITFAATVSNGTVPLLDAVATGVIDLSILRPFLTASSIKEFSGQASFDLSAKGEMREDATLQTSGQLVLQDVHYNDSLLPEPITDLDAHLQLAGDSVTIRQLSMKFPSSDLSLTGTARHLVPWVMAADDIASAKVAKPEIRFVASSHRFDSDKLFPTAAPGNGLDSTVTLSDTLPTSIFPDILANGTITFDTLIYCKLDLTDIKGKVAIKDRVVQCTEVTGKVYSGALSGATAIDFTNFNAPVYAGKFDGKGIEANDFMTRFTPLKGVLFGQADLSGSFGATGWEPLDFLKSLTLDGNSLIRSAKLMTSGVIKDGLTALAGKAGSTFNGEQAIRELTTKLKVANGRVFSDPFTIPLGDFGTVSFGGSYGFDNTAAGAGTIVLSEAASQKLAASGGVVGTLLGGSTNALSLPFAVGGSITQPTFSVDYEKAIASAASQAKAAAEAKAKEAAKGAIEKGLNDATKGVDSTLKNTAKGLLKELLKKP